MLLNDVFSQRSIKLDLESKTKDAALAELLEIITLEHPEYDYNEMYAAINSRENKMRSGIGSGIAVPHGYCRSINAITGAIGISKTGIDYNSLDHKPVHLVFMLVMGETSQESHLRVLNKVFTLVNSETGALMMTAKTAQEVYAMLSRIY
ncbi:MAG: PTS sugar transporter subunit IIA [Treponema sp.]|jgi:mannitol/fructose-specific phosphotransferase system IIA component (Ntr-type)|nr:PTS sugar transporter subunit IIA [Treponema sp.]